MRVCIIACTSDILSHTLNATVKGIDSSVCVRETRTFEELVAFLDKEMEQFLIIDSFFLGLNIEEQLRRIVEKNCRVKIVCVMLVHCERFFGMRLIRSGVNTIIGGRTEMKDFMAILRNVFAGRQYVPPDIAEAIEKREFFMRSENCRSITQREWQIIDLMVMGKSIKESAQMLSVAEGTVSAWRNRIFAKLGAANRTDAVRIALNNGYCVKAGGFEGAGEV